MHDSELATLRIEEYRALRSTIRERGTARVLVAVLTVVSWAVLFFLSLVAPAHRLLASAAELLVIAGGFEAAFALHVGVERIGRYLQAHYETDEPGGAQWEHAVMRLGGPGRPSRPGRPIDALFSRIFVLAAALNALPIATRLATIDPSQLNASLPRVAIATTGVLALHGLFFVRVIRAGHFAGRQRQEDLAGLAVDRNHPLSD